MGFVLLAGVLSFVKLREVKFFNFEEIRSHYNVQGKVLTHPLRVRL